jgi:hypothetical protein
MSSQMCVSRNPRVALKQLTNFQLALLKGVPVIKKSPTRTGSPILIGSRSEGLLMAETYAHLCTGEELTNQRRSFAQHPTAAAN